MQQNEAEYFFKTIQQSWPKWTPPVHEAQSWTAYLRRLSKHTATKARTLLIEACDRYNRPRIGAFKDCVRSVSSGSAQAEPERERGYWNVVCVEKDDKGSGDVGLRYEYVYYVEDEAGTDWISKSRIIVDQMHKRFGGYWTWIADTSQARAKVRELKGFDALEPLEGPKEQTTASLRHFERFKRVGYTTEGDGLYVKVP